MPLSDAIFSTWRNKSNDKPFSQYIIPQEYEKGTDQIYPGVTYSDLRYRDTPKAPSVETPFCMNTSVSTKRVIKAGHLPLKKRVMSAVSMHTRAVHHSTTVT